MIKIGKREIEKFQKYIHQMKGNNNHDSNNGDDDGGNVEVNRHHIAK